MSEIKELLSNPVQTILTILFLAIAIEWIYSRIKFYQGRADDYYNNRHEKEDFKEHVEKMDSIVSSHSDTLSDINSELKKLNEKMDNIEKQRDADFVVSARALLYQLYETLKDRESLTLSEYEAFDELAQKYLKKNGNGAYKHYVIPYILSKPIDDAKAED